MMDLKPLARWSRRLLLDFAARLVAKAVDRKLEAALPSVFELLDARLRSEMRANATPYRVVDLIRSSITTVTKEPATPEQIRTVIALFDPTRMGVK